MERQLNQTLVEEALAEKGFTQTSVAEALGITRAAVSKWFTGKSFPRPPELLKLGKLLGLGYAQLVLKAAPSASEPLIAFRKRASTKTTVEHVTHAKEMGRLLAPVVKHLPFDQFLAPRRLKNPSTDYAYVQAWVAELRKELKLDPIGPLEFTALIGKFKELQAVLIPVMWGQKTRHENALHIYLPDSKTTWIYLNLDSYFHDFKFWMAHELGHVLAVDLLKPETMEQAEDFSDAFAGALLFPEAAAKPVYEKYMTTRVSALRLNLVIETARTHVISPNTIYQELANYARAYSLPFEPLVQGTFFAAVTAFNKSHPTISAHLFKGEKPSADHFMRICAEVFKTPIFIALTSYLKETPQGDVLIGRILDVPLADAKELRNALV